MKFYFMNTRTLDTWEIEARNEIEAWDKMDEITTKDRLSGTDPMQHLIGTDSREIHLEDLNYFSGAREEEIALQTALDDITELMREQLNKQ